MVVDRSAVHGRCIGWVVSTAIWTCTVRTVRTVHLASVVWKKNSANLTWMPISMPDKLLFRSQQYGEIVMTMEVEVGGRFSHNPPFVFVGLRVKSCCSTGKQLRDQKVADVRASQTSHVGPIRTALVCTPSSSSTDQNYSSSRTTANIPSPSCGYTLS